jgi:hypothetical protein
MMQTKLRSFSLMLAFVGMFFSASAQTFKSGDQHLHLGVGFVSWYYGTDYSGIVPPVTASYEIGIADLDGVGTIGVGPFVGYSTSRTPKYNDLQGGKYWWRNTYLTIAARGAFHFDIFDDERFDTYAGLVLGYTIRSYTYQTSGVVGGTSYTYDYGSGYIARNLFGGMRYKASEKLRLFGEIGYGFTLVNVGIDFKIK